MDKICVTSFMNGPFSVNETGLSSLIKYIYKSQKLETSYERQNQRAEMSIVRAPKNKNVYFNCLLFTPYFYYYYSTDQGL